MGDHPSNTDLPLDMLRRVDAICERFETALRAGRASDPAVLLEKVSPQARPTLFRELLALDLEYAAPDQRASVWATWLQRFPECGDTTRGVAERGDARGAEG